MGLNQANFDVSIIFLVQNRKRYFFTLSWDVRCSCRYLFEQVNEYLLSISTLIKKHTIIIYGFSRKQVMRCQLGGTKLWQLNASIPSKISLTFNYNAFVCIWRGL